MAEIILPLPPPELSPNYKPLTKPMAKWGPASRYRERCGWMAKAQMIEQGLSAFQTPVQLNLSFHFRLRRRRDEGNLLASFKAGEDGLVDAGLLADDSAKHVSYAIEVLDGCEDEGVYVTWEEAE